MEQVLEQLLTSTNIWTSSVYTDYVATATGFDIGIIIAAALLVIVSIIGIVSFAKEDTDFSFAFMIVCGIACVFAIGTIIAMGFDLYTISNAPQAMFLHYILG